MVPERRARPCMGLKSKIEAVGHERADPEEMKRAGSVARGGRAERDRSGGCGVGQRRLPGSLVRVPKVRRAALVAIPRLHIGLQ